MIQRLSLTLSAALALGIISLAEPLPQSAEQLSGGSLVGPLVAEALRNNPSLAVAEARYQAALAGIDSAGALPNPKFQITHFVESIQTRTGPQRQALMLQQPIPWPGKLSQRRSIAKAKSDALWHAYATQQFEAIDQVSQIAFEVAYLDKAIVITEKNISLLERLENVVEDKVKAGGSLSDLLKLQVEIQTVEDRAAKQRTQRAVALAKLSSLLGKESRIDNIGVQLTGPAELSNGSQTWLDAIPERSPEIAMLRALERSEQAREQLSRFASRPDFSLGLNYIRTGESIAPSTPDSGQDPWALMVGVSLPIWNKANNAVALQAALEKEAVQAQIEALELKLTGEGRGWIAKVEDAQNRIHRYETQLIPLARQAQSISESSYRSGQASILDLIDSERALLKLETEFWRAAADAWLARWKLATLSGGLWLE